MKKLIAKFNNLEKDTQDFLFSTLCFILVVPCLLLIASTLFNK